MRLHVAIFVTENSPGHILLALSGGSLPER